MHSHKLLDPVCIKDALQQDDAESDQPRARAPNTSWEGVTKSSWNWMCGALKDCCKCVTTQTANQTCDWGNDCGLRHIAVRFAAQFRKDFCREPPGQRNRSLHNVLRWTGKVTTCVHVLRKGFPGMIFSREGSSKISFATRVGECLLYLHTVLQESLFSCVVSTTLAVSMRWLPFHA